MLHTAKQTWKVYTFMIFPAVFLFVFIIAFPILRSVYLSFTEYNVYQPKTIKWVWFANYMRVFRDPLFWRAFINNMVVIGVSLFGQIPIALILAYILYRKFVRFQNFFLAMVFLPQTISTIIIGILWRWIVINPRGFVTSLLQKITGNPEFVFELSLRKTTAMIPIAMVLIWIYTGFYVLIFIANLQKINSDILEAAEIDGATELQIFFRIVIPSQLGAIVITSILAIAGSLKGFDLIWAMTGGGPADYTIVLPIYMYKYAFQTTDIDAYSMGSTIATIIVIISIGLILLSKYAGLRAKRNMIGEVD